MNGFDRFATLKRKSSLAPKEVKPTWADNKIEARLNQLQQEAISTGRVTPIIEFFDNLNIAVYNGFRINLNGEGEFAEANRNRVVEIWNQKYETWYQKWYRELLKEQPTVAGGDFI